MILVFGTVCLDRIVRIPTLPIPGGYVEAASETAMLGGEAANTASLLHAWGADYVLAGNGLGHGRDHAELATLLAERGLRRTEEHTLDRTLTPVCDVFVTDDGERTMIGRGFQSLDASVDIDRIPYVPGGWFTADMNLGLAAQEAVRQAHQRGMRTYSMDFDPGDERDYRGSVWQSSTDWAGERGNSTRNLEVVRTISLPGATAILTDAANGAFVAAEGIPPRHLPSFRAANFVDATGAGDAFRAGMLFGLDQDWPLLRCLRFGAAAGCLMCQCSGGTSSTFTVQEIEHLIQSQPDIAEAYA